MDFKEWLTILVMIGRSDGRQAFSSQEGIGSRLQHLLLDFFMIDSISLIVTREKSDKLYETTGGRLGGGRR